VHGDEGARRLPPPLRDRGIVPALRVGRTELARAIRTAAKRARPRCCLFRQRGRTRDSPRAPGYESEIRAAKLPPPQIRFAKANQICEFQRGAERPPTRKNSTNLVQKKENENGIQVRLPGLEANQDLRKFDMSRRLPHDFTNLVQRTNQGGLGLPGLDERTRTRILEFQN